MRLLLLGADFNDRQAIGSLLPPDSWKIICHSSVKELQGVASTCGVIDVIVMNLESPVERSFDLIPLVKETCPKVEVILISRLAEEELWIESIQRGAYDLLSKPLEKSEFLRVIRNAVEKHSSP